MINPFNGEGIAYGYESGRLAAGVIGEALLSGDETMLSLYDERLQAAYGEYFKVARGFVRLISEPKVLQACVGLGLRVAPVMRELLKIMANLMSNDEKGLGERGYRAVAKLATIVPEPAWDLIFRDTND
jgi:flavin-dependent dehydrogenase